MKLVASDAKPEALFGTSVAIDGNRELIGACGENESGAVYLFDLNTGEQLKKIASPVGEDHNYRFGTTVALQKNLALIGAPDDDGPTNSGAAYLYDVNTGEQLYKFKASDAKAGGLFGYSVAMNAGYIMAGMTPGGVDGAPGAAYIFSLVPEPSTAAMAGTSIICFCSFSRRSRQCCERSGRSTCKVLPTLRDVAKNRC